MGNERLPYNFCPGQPVAAYHFISFCFQKRAAFCLIIVDHGKGSARL